MYWHRPQACFGAVHLGTRTEEISIWPTTLGAFIRSCPFHSFISALHDPQLITRACNVGLLHYKRCFDTPLALLAGGYACKSLLLVLSGRVRKSLALGMLSYRKKMIKRHCCSTAARPRSLVSIPCFSVPKLTSTCKVPAHKQDFRVACSCSTNRRWDPWCALLLWGVIV